MHHRYQYGPFTEFYTFPFRFWHPAIDFPYFGYTFYTLQGVNTGKGMVYQWNPYGAKALRKNGIRFCRHQAGI